MHKGGHEYLQNTYGVSADQAASFILLKRNFVDKYTYVIMKILEILVLLHGKITYIINIIIKVIKYGYVNYKCHISHL
jgi:hypothetical protein